MKAAEDSSSKYFKFNAEQYTVNNSSTITKDPFCCSICNCGYRYEYSLKRHVLRSHINRAYISPSDLDVFGITVDGHHKSSSDGLMFSCNACPRLYPNQKELQAHIRSNHQVSIVEPVSGSEHERGTVIITCPECKAEFYNMRSLNCHMRYHKSASWTPHRRSSPAKLKSTDDDTNRSPKNRHYPAQKRSQSITTRNSPLRSTRQKSTSPVRVKTANKALTKLYSPTKEQRTITESLPSLHNRDEQEKTKHSPSKINGDTVHDPNNQTGDKTDAEVSTEDKRRQLRQRTALQNPSMFICTICQRSFHSYGNMMRHRRMSHEAVIKKRPEIALAKRRFSRKRSKFCDAKIARRYYNKVASNIAFNVKNCMHGNLRHIQSSKYYIQDESKTVLNMLRSPQLNKKLANLCNIKTKSATSLLDKNPVKQSDSNTSNASLEETQKMKQFTLDSKSPDIYDKPGLWKFLCLVCMEYFPNTLELFSHQDTIHKRVNASYMEVGRSYELPLQAIATSNAVGCLKPTDKHQVVCTPAKYACTKCQSEHGSTDELHSHLIVCGKDLLKPITIEIPASTNPYSASQGSYKNKVKAKKSRSWHRREEDHTQRKIPDMNGFNIRKKKKRSRLESEVEEQMRMEAKLRLMSGVSPNNTSPTKSVLDPTVALTDISTHQSSHRSYTQTYSCQYCGITFKYRKVLQRHLDSACEMMKRIASPPSSIDEQSAQSSSIILPQERDNDLLQTEHQSPGKSILNNSTHDISDDLLDPQKSLAQARVLAKFFHPARTCGPCFTCKKPNMARRYSHLQQRSASFVQFVKSKHKNISMQSCICKACELKFKSEYEKRKSRLAKYAGNRKSPFKTRSLASKSGSAGKMSSVKNKKTPSKKAGRKSKLINQDGVGDTSKKSTGTASRPDKRQYHCGKVNKEDKMSSLKRKSYTPVSVPQSKSLEQIFPEQSDSSNVSTAVSVLEADSKMGGETTKKHRKPDTFIPDDGDIIEPETLLRTSSPAVSSKLHKRGIPEQVSPGRKRRSDLFTEFPLDLEGGGSQEQSHAEHDARLKVILKFVKGSPSGHRFTEGSRTSITEIVDAVTERVKEDPGAAQTLTAAINSAVLAASRQQRHDRVLRQSRHASGSGVARQSISLPSVLDGLVTKTVLSSTKLTEEVKIRRVISATLPNNKSTSLDVEPCRSSNTLPLVIEQTMVRPKLLSTSPTSGKKLIKDAKPLNSSKGPTKKASTAKGSSDEELVRQETSTDSVKKPAKRPQQKAESTQPCESYEGHKIGQPKLSPHFHLSQLKTGARPNHKYQPTQHATCTFIPPKQYSHYSPSAQTQVRPDMAGNASVPQLSMYNGMKHNTCQMETESADPSCLPEGHNSVSCQETKSGRKRKYNDVNERAPAAFKPRRKFVMTESSYKHMVEIIDGVASGAIDISTYRYDSLVPEIAESESGSISAPPTPRETPSPPAPPPAKCERMTTPDYDFMREDSRQNPLECIRVCDSERGVGRKLPYHEDTPGGDVIRPIKNQRLASIISKLSGAKDEGVASSSPQPQTSTSPTGSQNQGSMDSGFVSLTE